MLIAIKLCALAAAIIFVAEFVASDEVDDANLANLLADLNTDLLSGGMDVQIDSVSLYADIEHADQSRTVLAKNVGNKQLPYQWVPFDPRRGGRRELTWTIDTTDDETKNPVTSKVTFDQSHLAFDAAASTWNKVKCSDIPLEKVDSPPDTDLGFVQYLLTRGSQGFPGWTADITHAGFLPKKFFDSITPGGGNFILAAAFTLTWVSPITKSEKRETALSEIYYNDKFQWTTNESPGGYDIQTVATHEVGHSLGQGHFGTIALHKKKGRVYSPRAVMNAAYGGLLRELQGTDIGGHCSIYGDWPNI